MRRAWPLLVMMIGCESTLPATGAPPAEECATRDVLAVLSDYSVASYVGALGPSEVAVQTSIEFGSDPVLRISGDSAFVLNRGDALLFPLSPRCGDVIGEKQLLAPAQQAWNPQDVACTADGELWVPFFNRPLLRIQPQGVDPIDLPLAQYDRDGNPNAASVLFFEVEGRQKAFVSLEMLDDEDLQLPPKAPGKLLRFDVERREIDGEHTLIGWNPFGLLQRVGPWIYLNDIAAPQRADDRNGGIEIFDPERNVSRLWLDEVTLGGSIAQLAVNGACGAAIVFGGGATNPTSLLTFSAPRDRQELDAGQARVLARDVMQTDGYDLQGLAWQGDALYVGDRRALAAGYAVHRFKVDAQCTLSADGALTVPQKPVALLPTLRP